jgi:hypothetical protein
MNALGVAGDPDGWQHAADTLLAVYKQLDEDLSAADGSGGHGLRQSWSGPVCDSYQDLWSQRYNRYGDLIFQVQRAAQAIGDFAGELANLQYRAYQLEKCWLGAGLHLAADGMEFMLPFGHENLPQEIQATLHGALSESASDIRGMWNDIERAVSDVVGILESVLDVLADFQVIAFSVAGFTISWAVKGLQEMVRDDIKDPISLGGDVLEREARVLKVRAEHNVRVAHALEEDWSTDADQDVRAAGHSLVRDADEDRAVAGDFDDFAEIGADVMTVAAAAIFAGETYVEARKRGWDNAIEDHAGDWASLAAGVGVTAGVDLLLGTAAVAAVAAAAPVLTAVGLVVAGGLVCAGVGAGVQYEVNHHRAGTTRVLNDIAEDYKRTPFAHDM